jgi:hypothetical protein
VQPFDADGVADWPAKSAMDAKKGRGSNLVVSLLGAHMVNDNWKSQGPSYQLPARDVGFCLLWRRCIANKQSVSIKIFHPAQILAGSYQKAWERVKEGRRLCFPRSSSGSGLRPDHKQLLSRLSTQAVA